MRIGDPLTPVIDAVTGVHRDSDRRVTVVGVGGSVGVGKSRIAQDLAAGVRAVLEADEGGIGTVGVLSTDALLLDNAALDRLGLTTRKGFPDSFDADRSTAFVAALRRGDATVMLPEYSHFTYDLVPGSTASVPVPDVCVIEGVIAFQSPLAPGVDVGVYVDARDIDIERWFTERLIRLIREADAEPGGFYAGFGDAPAGAIEEFADHVWTGINAVNLREHIGPSRSAADWIVRKGSDHTIEAVVPGTGIRG